MSYAIGKTANKRTARFKLQCILLPALLLLAHDLHAAEPSFTPLPSIPGLNVRVNALSTNGEVAVGGGFRWTRAGGMVEFPGFARDVSADGSVVVGYGVPPGQRFPHAFRWVDGEGMTWLQHASFMGQSYSFGVSADGSVVVGESHGAVYWLSDGRARGIGGVGSHSWAEAASHDGSIIVGRSVGLDGVSSSTFLSDRGRTVFLEALPGDVQDMTPDGRVIVGGGSLGGFLWTAETGVTTIGIIAGAVSDDGQFVIGGFGLNRPAIWTAASGTVELQPFLTSLGLELDGWRLTSVDAISGDGTTLAGQGVPPNPSMSGAWIAVIPEPSTWALGGSALAVAILGMLLRRRSR